MVINKSFEEFLLKNLKKAQSRSNIIYEDHFILTDKKTISSENDEGERGTFAYDNDYLSICINKNSWKQIPLGNFNIQYLTEETDPIWTSEKTNYYTKTEIDNFNFIDLGDLSGTSPINYNSGTGAFSFDFSTNNTWTGDNIFTKTLFLQRTGGDIGIGLERTDGAAGLFNAGSYGMGFLFEDNREFVVAYGSRANIVAGNFVGGNLLAVRQTGGIPRVGVGGSLNTAAMDTYFHVFVSDASATSNSDTHATIERNGNTGLNILTSTTGVGAVYFGDSGNSSIGGVKYAHSTDSLILRAGARDKFTITDAGGMSGDKLNLTATTDALKIATDREIFSYNIQLLKFGADDGVVFEGNPLTISWSSIEDGNGRLEFRDTGTYYYDVAFGTIKKGVWEGEVIKADYGGTENAFFKVSGPATSVKTYTFPNASETIGTLGQTQTFTGAKTFSSSSNSFRGTYKSSDDTAGATISTSFFDYFGSEWYVIVKNGLVITFEVI